MVFFDRFVTRPMMRVESGQHKFVGTRFYGVSFPNAEYGMNCPSVRYLVNLGVIRPKVRFCGTKITLSAKQFKEFAYLYARDLEQYQKHMGRKFLVIAKALIESADSKEVSWR